MKRIKEKELGKVEVTNQVLELYLIAKASMSAFGKRAEAVTIKTSSLLDVELKYVKRSAMKIPIIALCCLIATLLVITPAVDAKRKKNKSSSSYSPAAKSKTKTKWSTTMDSSPDGANPMVATEEHGYYVKRTFVAPDGTVRTNISKNSTSKSVPYLAIPIAWFPCPEGLACRNGVSAISNAGVNALSEGFLCDDDCTEPYEPICGRTPTEIAVFYNKCKLNVAKCRTHGYWIDFPIDECRKEYPKELEYTDSKFKTSPCFKSKATENTEATQQALANIPSSSEASPAIDLKEQNPETIIQINKSQRNVNIN